MREYLDPCDECHQMPAVQDDLCHGCMVRLRREAEAEYEAEYEAEPEDDYPDDDASDRAQAEWERHYHRGE